jgi:ribosomal protein S18 acetylase RimI-like enzyme
MTLEIRTAVSADADGIATAHVSAWRVAYRGLVPDHYLDGDEFERSRFVGWTAALTEGPDADEDPLSQLLVPTLDGRIVGFGIFGRERLDLGTDATGRGELYGFYLHPDVWGTGIADALIERCHAGLVERFDAAVLWVLRDNTRARRFYERSGWACGVGSEVVETAWVGPQMEGLDPLPKPLAEVRYRIDLG